MGIIGINSGYYGTNYNGGVRYARPNEDLVLTTPLLNNTGFYDRQQYSYNLTHSNKNIEMNDGKIGFWKATGYLLKGGLDFITSPFCDENGKFSLTQTIKSAVTALGIAAATAIPVIGPLVVPTLLAAGVTFGTLGALNAAANILTADTDAEDKAAWASLGKNMTQVGLSIFGAKKYASSKAGHDVGWKDGVKQVFKEPIDAVKNGYNTIKDANLGTLAQRTGLDRVINGLRPSVAGAEAGAEAAVTEAAAETVSVSAAESGAASTGAANRPLFANTREWLCNQYEANRNMTLGELTSNAYNSGKTWAYDHGFRNNIRGYEIPAAIAIYDTIS